CGVSVTESNLVKHLAYHGIKGLPSHAKVTCRVCGKPMKRESILRHFREGHMKQQRKPSMK
ncbi:hypothetical protein SCLCIDRAFT_54327, partial [Scleroderma citrinum Foug A]